MQSVKKDSFTHARRYSFISKRKYFLVSETYEYIRTSMEITLWMPHNWNKNKTSMPFFYPV